LKHLFGHGATTQLALLHHERFDVGL
jgi:hypothetical protein